MPILDEFGRPISRAESSRSEKAANRSADMKLRARYDAAMLTDDTRRQWFMADGWQADAENQPGIRRLLRNRCRYEVANNCYAQGIATSLASDTIGTGPRLQMQTANDNANRQIEILFNSWCEEIDLGLHLRTMRKARYESGEMFFLLATNPKLDHEVKLDLKDIEADQVCTPDLIAYGPEQLDGIRFDKYGNPIEYHLLKYHPGTMLMGLGMAYDYDKIPAEQVIHYFMPQRPGQRRGIPDAVPTLLLLLQLRRYTLAVLNGAETAADFSALLFTDAPADGEADEIEPLDRIELVKKQLTTLPAGWQMQQLKAEQPTTTYGEFKGEILNEIGRASDMPFNRAAGNSSKYNYASGRMDAQGYHRTICSDRRHIEHHVLRRVLRAFFDEASLIPGLLPSGLGPFATWSHSWYWDGWGHVDPSKEAEAQAARLANNTTTLAEECAREGRNWENVLRQRAREIALMEELGIPQANQPGAPPAVEPAEEGSSS